MNTIPALDGRRRRNVRFRLGVVLLSPVLLLAADPAVPDPSSALSAGDDIRIPEVFTSHLPQTLRAGGLRIFIHPHLGDLSIRDYFRITTGVRYGLTRNWEVSAKADGYFSHGLGDVAFFKQAGFSTLELGTKYDLGSCIIAGWNTGVGLDFSTPVSRPPADLTDGMRHYNPYFVASRRLPSHPSIRVFWGAGADFVQHTDRPRELQKNQLDDDATELSAGAVWDRRSLHYTFEISWASTRLLGQTRADTLTLRPGVIWEVPWFRARHPGRIILLGGAVSTSFGPDGTDIGIGAKLRVNFNPKAR